MNTDEPIPLLTADQRELVRKTGHGAVRRALKEARRLHGAILSHVTDAQMLTEGTISLAYSAHKFDPERSQNPDRDEAFEAWAFHRAWYAMLDLARDDRRFGKIKAQMREAVYQHVSAARRPAVEVSDEAPEEARAQVAAFADGVAMTVLARVGLRRPRGEADMIEREAVERVESALALVVGELRPEQRRMLDQHFAQGTSLKDIAKALGEGYRGVLDEYHALLARMAARLRTLGVHEVPPMLDAAILPRSAEQ